MVSAIDAHMFDLHRMSGGGGRRIRLGPWVAILMLPALLFAADPAEEALQEKIKAVAKSLRCAVCQSESVWESNAELALQMRAIIRERLIRGESPDQIRAYFQSRYGDFILLSPRASGLNLLLWLGPFLLLLCGGLALYRTLRKWTVNAAHATPSTPAPLDAQSQARIEAALRSFQDDQ